MSAVLVYNVHAAKEIDNYSPTADWCGLTKLLGYRPRFTTYVNPDSLVDTWFRIYASTRNFCDVIEVFEVDERYVVPLDTVAWQDECIGQSGERKADDDTLRSVLTDAHPECTEYLLRPDFVAKSRWRFTPDDLISGLCDYPLDQKSSRALAASLAEVRRTMTAAAGYDDDARYAMVCMSGAIPLIYSIVLGKPVAAEVIAIKPADLVKKTRVGETMRMLRSWDEALAAGRTFSHRDYKTLRTTFVSGLNAYARTLVAERANKAGVSRNDPCFCGSSKKFKVCCARKGMDEIARTW